MNQTDRIIKLAEVDAEIVRLEGDVDMAADRLRVVEESRQEIAHGCTHVDEQGVSAVEGGLMGPECRLCFCQDVSQ